MNPCWLWFMKFKDTEKIHPQNVVYKIGKETMPLQEYLIVGIYYI